MLDPVPFGPKYSFCVLLSVVLFVLLFTSVSLSQSVQGVITGTVTDPAGAVVANAPVSITNQGTGVTQETKTSANGVYRFPLVPPGTYTVEVRAENFATQKASGITVDASQVVPFNIKLEIAKTNLVVEVSGAAPLVQTATSDQSMQVDNVMIENMALVDRDVLASLPFMAPQVQPGMDLTPTSGGARESGTSYLLNGGENNDNFDEGGITIHPPLESIQDFSILTNNMSAEYGRGAGAVVTANQKTGTNRFHGVLYEFNRNALLNANDWFYNRDLYNQQSLPADQQSLSKRPKYIRNQFGGEVDGPIFKDKTFFSFAYDRNKLLSGGTSANNFVPTSAAVAFIAANGSPIAQAVLKARPPRTSDLSCPSSPGNTGAGTDPNTGLPFLVGCLSFFDPQTDTIDTYFGRLDHNFSTKDRLSFSANVTRETYDDKFGGGPLTTNGPISSFIFNHDHLLSLSETHTFNSSLLNEVTINHNRLSAIDQEGNGVKDSLPNLLIDNQNEGFLSYYLGGDYEGGQVANFPEDRWSAQDNLTKTLARHSLKFGGGGSYGNFYRNWDLGLPGQYEFGELIAVNGNCPSCSVITPSTDPNGSTLQSDGTIANLQAENVTNLAGDYPYYEETSVNPTTGAHAGDYRHYTYHDYYVFAQDDWKATRRLTINLGLRWDRYGAPSEVHNLISQFTNFNCNILDPSCIASVRVGPVKRMWPTQNHDFGPRLGFAWDPMGDGKTAVRGGYGIFYDRIFDNIWSNGSWNPPFYALLDFQADFGDAIYYQNPASIGPAYDPAGPCGPIPYAPGVPAGCTDHKRVSVRTMDPHMRDSSGQNYYLGVERQIPGKILLRVNYQGSLGRHLPMLENYNRVDGMGYNSTFNRIRPNPLYTGFNFRSNSVSSNYNSLVLEGKRRMANGLEFETGYTYSKLLDVNSELFAGCSTIGSINAPYYYTTNANPHLEYGRAAFDHRHAFKFSMVYQVPFMKAQKGFAGHAFGGWTLASFLQMYSGHPFNVWDGRQPYAATDLLGNTMLDANGIPINLGGDYNLDGVTNDRPVFVGSSLGSVYSGASPGAHGVFKDSNIIGCAAPWVASTADIASCNANFGVAGATASPGSGVSGSPGTPNSMFVIPNYPGSGPLYERFGNLGRNVFQGPRFYQMDLSLGKGFKIREGSSLEFKWQVQNLFNHPNFDGIDGNLASSTFGQAQVLTPFGLGSPKSRVMSLGLRYSF